MAPGDFRPSSYDGSLSTISVRLHHVLLFSYSLTEGSIRQSGSMVEIKCSSSAEAYGDPLSPTSIDGHEEDKYRLVYSKSKVYVNPTAYARDNIPGFVALVKRVSQIEGLVRWKLSQRHHRKRPILLTC